MKSYRIAAIPGDGIGNEVIPAGIEVLQKLSDGFRLEFDRVSPESVVLGGVVLDAPRS